VASTETGLTSSANASPGATQATASITPTANRLVKLSINISWASQQTTAPALTITYGGTGLTFELIASVMHWPVGSDWWNTQYLYRALGASPTAGAITIDPGVVSMDAIAWAVSETSDVDTSGTNGSGAVVQSATNFNGPSVSALAATLAAFGSANNATFACFGCGDTDATVRTFAPSAPDSEIHDTGAQYSSIGTQFYSGNNTTPDTTVSASLTGDSGIAGIAIEIKAASSGYTLVVGAGSSALSGQTVATKYGRNLSAAAGAHTYTGVAVTLARGLKAAIDAGAHVLSGQAVSLLRGYRAAADTGAHAHTGVAVALLRGALAAVSAAAYSVAGQAVSLTKGAAAGAYSMLAGAGSYLLTGRGVDLIWQSYIAPIVTPTRSGTPLSRAGRNKYQAWLYRGGNRR